MYNLSVGEWAVVLSARRLGWACPGWRGWRPRGPRSEARYESYATEDRRHKMSKL